MATFHNRTGRWTPDERQLLIQGFVYFGANYSLIGDYIGSRTGSQVRSKLQHVLHNIPAKEYSDIVEGCRALHKFCVTIQNT